MNKVTIFYDASCPLCVKEMTSLKYHLGTHAKFVNVLNAEAMKHHPSISVEESRRLLHVIDEMGDLRLAVDANVYLWQLTGTKHYLKMLRWPLIRPFVNACYTLFARHRYKISRLLTGKSRCKQCEL